jgi:CRISPR-associated endonuclease Cas2
VATIPHTNGNKTYIVSYDFTSDKLRRGIDKTLWDYGVRLQRSVFSCSISEEQVKALSEKLAAVIDKFHFDRKPGDSLVIIGGLTEKNLDFLVGSPYKSHSFMVF